MRFYQVEIYSYFEGNRVEYNVLNYYSLNFAIEKLRDIYLPSKVNLVKDKQNIWILDNTCKYKVNIKINNIAYDVTCDNQYIEEEIALLNYLLYPVINIEIIYAGESETDGATKREVRIAEVTLDDNPMHAGYRF